MDALHIDYAGMNAGVITAWFAIATGAGFLARMIVRGRSIIGLWGDAAIGLIGIYLVGTLFRAFDFDLSVYLKEIQPDWDFDLAVWLDITIAAALGSLLIRAIIRPFTGKKKG